MAFEAIQYEVADYIIKPLQRIDFIKSILKIKKSIGEDDVFVTQNQIITTLQELKVEQPQIPVDVQEPEEEEILFLNENDEELLIEQPQTTSEDTIEKDTTEEDTTEEDIAGLDEIEDSFEEQIPETYVQQPNPNNKQPLVLCIKSYGDYRYIDASDICYFQADNNSTDIHLNNGEMVTAFKTLKHFEGVLPFPFARIHNSYIVNRSYISRIHTGNAVCYIKNTTTKLPFSKSYKENVDLIISEFANGNYLEI